jgi:hypothetical protein
VLGIDGLRQCPVQSIVDENLLRQYKSIRDDWEGFLNMAFEALFTHFRQQEMTEQGFLSFLFNLRGDKILEEETRE